MPTLQTLPGIPLVESPLFELLLPDLGLSSEQEAIARSLHDKGFAIIDFPDPDIGERIDRIRQRLAPTFESNDPEVGTGTNPAAGRRVQDAWLVDQDIRAIAANAELLSLLKKLYGRTAIPFQTLNFPVGTEQKLHSDSSHFSSIPERFMCGVWLAMEDVHADAGPVAYLPGSHKWPVLKNLTIGRKADDQLAGSAQDPFEPAWRELQAASGIEPELLVISKGQAMIWAANLLHGGSKQHDRSRTRWSQVTHYYFVDCIYYTPVRSDEALGKLDIRSIVNVGTGQPVSSMYLGSKVVSETHQEKRVRRWPWQRIRSSGPAGRTDVALPQDFSAERYLSLNPDVSVSGIDPELHYVTYGAKEGRNYK